MKKINKKIIATAILSSIVFTNTIYAFDEKNSSPVKKSDEVIQKVLDRYEQKISKSSFLRERLKAERAQKLSDYMKEEIIKNEFESASKIDLFSDGEIKKAKNNNDKNNLFRQLKKAIEKTEDGTYKLVIKTSLTEEETKNIFSFFDDLTLTKIDDNGFYEIIFKSTSKIGKLLKTSLSNGQIPGNLMEQIEIVKPILLKVDNSEITNYLSGESSNLNWGIPKIGATDYQYALSKLQKVKVGVIDTGVDYNHSDLKSNLDLTLAKNFVNSSATAQDDHGHGTHVAGVIGAGVNGGGIYGVNSNISIVPLKVLDSSGYTTSYTLADSINYAANNGIKVINMSLGGDGNPTNDIICNAITNAKNKGTISVVAAGNENADVSAKVPAGCSDAITVGAVDDKLNKASFSNYGSEVDVSAPGVNIYSTLNGNTYGKMSGTSMATPFVAGLVGAMLANSGTLTQVQLNEILKTTGYNTNSTVNIGKFISMTGSLSYIQAKKDSDYNTNTGTTNPPPNTNTGTTNPSPNTNTGTTNPPPNTNTGTTNPPPNTNTGTTNPPIQNKIPKLKLNTYKNFKNNYVNISGSDTDGYFSSFIVYLNGQKYLSYSGAKSYSFRLSSRIGTTYEIKVVGVDNSGASVEKVITIK